MHAAARMRVTEHVHPVAATIARGGLAYIQRGGKVDALGVYGDGFFASLPGAMLGFAVAADFSAGSLLWHAGYQYGCRFGSV